MNIEQPASGKAGISFFIDMKYESTRPIHNGICNNVFNFLKKSTESVSYIGLFAGTSKNSGELDEH
ncbi:hypothetical protein [uncultured Microbulbifer sp.]|uniref:hypothetical protein n=1 Tax=uncultured Microbulbifer sp. TaxID=348147 RepID=UPI00262B16D5|nr:hypothetical protein [uncultured Microbulbifer sp.]